MIGWPSIATFPRLGKPAGKVFQGLENEFFPRLSCRISSGPFRLWTFARVLPALLLVTSLTVGCRHGGPSGPASAAELPAVRASVEPERARIGDPLRIELTLVCAEGETPEAPEPSAIFEIRNRALTTERLRDGRIRTRVTYEALCFDVGRHPLFTNAVVRVAADGERRELPPPEAAVEIVSVLDDTVGGPRDIKPPLPWPPALPRWIWALPVVILAAVLVSLAVRAWMRRHERRPPPLPPPPDRVALEALERLRTGGAVEAESAEPFYVELSRIVRVYLEARFGLRAPEQTTEEFIRAAAASERLSGEHRTLTAAFLEESDLVKFAQAQPGAEARRRALAAAERLVRETAARTSEEGRTP